MKVAFFSNFLNIHQIPFCNAMHKRLNGDFYFIATEKISEERLSMGFEDANEMYPYVVKAYEETGYAQALKLGSESDVVIIGSAPDSLIAQRLKENKVTFRYCERYFKQGKWRILDPRVLKARFQSDIRYRSKNVYMLCASAYTAPDCRFIFSYPGKTYKWGYFTKVDCRDIREIMQHKHTDNPTILWAGRLIALKHPDAAVRVAEQLKQAGCRFTLNIVGNGTMYEELARSIAEKDLQDCVHLLGGMQPEAVHAQMMEADIFLFTSDKQEGWGAVLNESMAAGCAVVASSEVGSAPFLIKDGENGFLYYKNDVAELYRKTEELINHPVMRKEMGEKACFTMQKLWSPENAADRLIQLMTGICGGESVFFADGPCSEAK